MASKVRLVIPSAKLIETEANSDRRAAAILAAAFIIFLTVVAVGAILSSM